MIELVLRVRNLYGRLVRLTRSMWEYVLKTHPEFQQGDLQKIRETINDPDMIQEGDEGALMAIRRFKKTRLSDKFLI